MAAVQAVARRHESLLGDELHDVTALDTYYDIAIRVAEEAAAGPSHQDYDRTESVARVIVAWMWGGLGRDRYPS